MFVVTRFHCFTHHGRIVASWCGLVPVKLASAKPCGIVWPRALFCSLLPPSPTGTASHYAVRCPPSLRSKPIPGEPWILNAESFSSGLSTPLPPAFRAHFARIRIRIFCLKRWGVVKRRGLHSSYVSPWERIRDGESCTWTAFHLTPRIIDRIPQLVCSAWFNLYYHHQGVPADLQSTSYHRTLPLIQTLTCPQELKSLRVSPNPNRYEHDPLTGRNLRQTSLPLLPKTLPGSEPRCNSFLSSSPQRCGPNNRPMVPLRSVHWKRRVS